MDQGIALYSAQQSRDLDARAIRDFAIDGYELMQRAAAASWQALRQHFAAVGSVGCLVGPGNNGGDALEVARLARAAGCPLRLHVLSDPDKFSGEAAQAWAASQADQISVASGEPDWAACDVWVDGLFGSGLVRAVEGKAARWIEGLNQSGRPVFALDIPSGIHADTGAVLGSAIRAHLTMSFIARKKGLYTGAALDHVGQLMFSDLALPGPVFDGFEPAAMLLPEATAWSCLPPRARNSHKGSNGHVLMIGGAPGYSGAIRLAGMAALRAGAGLVSIYTHELSHELVAAACPELMVHCHGLGQALDQLMQRADVLVVGPGLGQGPWGQSEFEVAMDFPGACVLDADALNLLAANPRTLPGNWVLTPHPGEAARLLGLSAREVQADRFAAISALLQRYSARCVLKGAGSLIAIEGQQIAICPQGNPGMAVAGMGDVLSGVIAALLAQAPEPMDQKAAIAGAVMAHAQAGDLVARRQGQRGLLPSDIIAVLPEVLNP